MATSLFEASQQFNNNNRANQQSFNEGLSRLANELSSQQKQQRLSEIMGSALNPDGTINQQMVIQGLAQEDPGSVLSAINNFQNMNQSAERFEQDKKMNDLNFKASEIKIQKDIFDRLFRRLYSIDSPDKYELWKKEYYNQGANEYYGDLNQEYSPGYIKTLISMGMDENQRIDRQLKELELQNAQLGLQKTEADIARINRSNTGTGSNRTAAQTALDESKLITEQLRQDQLRENTRKTSIANEGKSTDEVNGYKKAIDGLNANKQKIDVYKGDINSAISAIENITLKPLSNSDSWYSGVTGRVQLENLVNKGMSNQTVQRALNAYDVVLGATALRELKEMKELSANGASGLGNASNLEFGTLSQASGLPRISDNQRDNVVMIINSKNDIVDRLKRLRDNVDEKVKLYNIKLEELKSILGSQKTRDTDNFSNTEVIQPQTQPQRRSVFTQFESYLQNQ